MYDRRERNLKVFLYPSFLFIFIFYFFQVWHLQAAFFVCERHSLLDRRWYACSFSISEPEKRKIEKKGQLCVLGFRGGGARAPSLLVAHAAGGEVTRRVRVRSLSLRPFPFDAFDSADLPLLFLGIF